MNNPFNITNVGPNVPLDSKTRLSILPCFPEGAARGIQNGAVSLFEQFLTLLAAVPIKKIKTQDYVRPRSRSTSTCGRLTIVSSRCPTNRACKSCI